MWKVHAGDLTMGDVDLKLWLRRAELVVGSGPRLPEPAHCGFRGLSDGDCLETGTR